MRNCIVYDNPNAMSHDIPTFPPGFNKQLSTFGRGQGGIVITVSPGPTTTVEGITMFSQSTVAVQVADGTNSQTGNCSIETCSVTYRNNINVQFISGAATGWNSSTGEYADRIYADDGIAYEVLQYSTTIFDHNLSLNDKAACPLTWLNGN